MGLDLQYQAASDDPLNVETAVLVVVVVVVGSAVFFGNCYCWQYLVLV